jgi:ribosomal protein S18 acetylase RimI-like enzyme
MFFIRSAADADLTGVSNLLARSWHATYDALFGADKVDQVIVASFDVALLKAKLARPDSEFIVADDGRRIGGMAYATMDEQSKDAVRLQQIYVDPDLLGQGIGKDLFAEIETCFPDAKRILLDVEERNLRAIGFYKRLGFHQVGEDKNHGGGILTATALVLEKKLEF